MEATLRAQKRDTRGKNEARRLRQQGLIPAVVYGGKDEPTPIAVDAKILSGILHSEAGANSLIDLDVEGAGVTKVLVKDFLLEPVHRKLLHADFYRVAMDRKIQVTVPVVVVGEPKGVKLQGGVLDIPHREVEIECLPGDIPEHIEIDVADMIVGQAIRLRDVVGTARWTALSDPELMLAHVVAPRVVEEAPAEAAAAPATAEPEVIKKGKAEDEE
ncbi:MAG: 50S ribosomal protein L25 [Vicinamibacteraceae bacterium]|nr:50S ribosomal protein L25 [Vicinamibacteraceae bacterium]